MDGAYPEGEASIAIVRRNRKMVHAGRLYDDDFNMIIPDDCFTCGMGLYASLYFGDRLLVFEMVNLDGQKLGKGLEDYCFIAAPDMLSPIKAEARRANGENDENAINSARLNDMRRLWEIEEQIGCRVLDHEAVRSGLFYHVDFSEEGLFAPKLFSADEEEHSDADPALDSNQTQAFGADEICTGDRLLGIYDVLYGPISGGRGSVFKVRHVGWNAVMALKRPQAEFFITEKQKEVFIRECETWVGLGFHPHIVRCHYVRDVLGIPSIFSEWMDGGSLENQLESGTFYSGSEAMIQKCILDIAIQTARGLSFAHERGLIHQDVKPGNILLTKGGTVKVADFGISQALGEDGLGGYTPAYCAPEQVNRKTIRKSTDVYAWAAVVLEMYLGERLWQWGPVAGASFEEYIDFVRVPVSETMKDLLRRCLNEESRDRPQDFAEVEMELLLAYEEETGTVYSRSVWQEQREGADVLSNRALSFVDLGKYGEAIACLEKAIEQEPVYDIPRINIEIVKLRQKAELEQDDHLKAYLDRTPLVYAQIFPEDE